MSVMEHGPSAFSQTGDVDDWTPPQDVVDNLSARLAAIHQVKSELVDSESNNTSDMYDDQDSPLEGLAIEEPATERASSRIGDLLRASADRADTFTESAAETTEKAKVRLRSVGSAALTRLKNAGKISLGLTLLAGEASIQGVKTAGDKSGDALMAGFSKLETGMDKAGTAVASRKAKAVEGYQTFQFNRETKANDRQFRKDYAKETKAFDKNAAKETKVQAKQDKIELKQAGREDKRFERSMTKKAAQERRAERRARWSANWNTVKETGVAGVDIIKNAPTRAGDAMMNGFAKLEDGMDWAGDKMNDAAESAKERADRAKRKARITRTAARVALHTYRDTKEAFKHN